MRAAIVRVEPVHAPSIDYPREDRLVEGRPRRQTWTACETQGIACGIWSCEAGAWKIRFAENRQEFFCVISGRVVLTDEAGRAEVFGAGEAGVIPPGFAGEFRVLEPVSKYFVVADAKLA